MRDDRKLLLAVVLSAALVALVILQNGFGEYVAEKYGSYLKRRLYYERVISREGLSLHKGKYWEKMP